VPSFTDFAVVAADETNFSNFPTSSTTTTTTTTTATATSTATPAATVSQLYHYDNKARKVASQFRFYDRQHHRSKR
jgi:hypothetical protein